jgi:hypothetical protein
MSIQHLYGVACDWPGCHDAYLSTAESTGEARSRARGDHWGQRKPETGFTYIDLCPDHKDEFDNRMRTTDPV